MDTTFKELLEMRQALDAALEEKIGQKPAAGFDIGVCSFSPSNIKFHCAYSYSITTEHRVDGGLAFETPQEAYDYALECINAL